MMSLPITKPTCLRILDYDMYTSNTHLHDVECYDETNDDDIGHLTHINNSISPPSMLSTSDLTTSINVFNTQQQQQQQQQQHTVNTYTFQELGNTV